MCGIIGVVGKKDEEFLARGMELLTTRGSDGSATAEIQVNKQPALLGHMLHAVVNTVPQPIEDRFIANCEIYNWEALKKKFDLKARNDAETLFLLLEKKGLDALQKVDGVYAFAWVKENKLILARDLLGVKPLCYSVNNNVLYFASENKALSEGQQLNPRKILVYGEGNISFTERPFFTPKKVDENPQKTVAELLTQAVEKRVNGLEKIGILFSGGVDSTLLAFICKQHAVTLYTAGTEDSPDIIEAEKAAKFLKLPLKKYILKEEELEEQLKKVIEIIETTNYVKVSVALVFHLAAQLAKQDKQKVLLSGLGSEELFAGYQRHVDAKNINEECLKGLLQLYDRDLYRDDLITMAHSIELRLPFLDQELVHYALGIPADKKIKDDIKKWTLRKAAVQSGLPETFAFRPKKAAQYGSGIDKLIAKVAKKAGVAKQKFLNVF